MDGSVTLTVSPHMKQHLPVSCLPVESKTCCLGTAKADAASDTTSKATVVRDTMFRLVFEKVFMTAPF
jgi:hypothetical protein